MQMRWKKGRKIIDIPIVQIRPCRTQARRNYSSDKLKELALSIRHNGIIQPLIVRRVSAAEYELVAGERRLRAAAMCGIRRVPCILISCTDGQAGILSLAENLQRSELNVFEQARGINRLMTVCHISEKDAARQLGQRLSSLEEKLKVLNFSSEERELITKANMTERHCRALLSVDDPVERRYIISEIIENNMNVSQTEKYINEYLCMTKRERRLKQRQKVVIKDIRLFENTIIKAVKAMRASGIAVAAAQSESEAYIEYMVRVPKLKRQTMEKTA